ncbi:MAG: non-canonical purine NTP pyrophosphatase [Myxococcota bacterium]
MRVFFVTKNERKWEECEAIVAKLKAGRDIEVLWGKYEIEEILETDHDKLIREKALKAWEHVRAPVFVEHGGLQINYFNLLPGTLVQPFWRAMEQDLGAKIPPGVDRGAVSLRGACYCDGRTRKVFQVERKGVIAEQPRGSAGFHWDPLFIPDDQPDPSRPARTYAEMTQEEKLSVSGSHEVIGALLDHLSPKKAG